MTVTARSGGTPDRRGSPPAGGRAAPATAPRTGSTAARAGAPVARKTATGTQPARSVGSAARSTPVPPELRVVPAPKRGRRAGLAAHSRGAPFALLLVVLLVATALGLLVLNTAIAVDSLKATRLRAENAQRVQDIQRLQKEVVTGSTPASLAEAAAKAGLVPAGPAGYLVIAPDGTSTIRGTAEPAASPAAADGD